MGVRGTITYQPALDGVRAVAVACVLLFHARVPGFGGGYLGVSMFFTLSGFLITSLLVTEHDREGRIDVGEFYRRRVRRLIPASAVCLVSVVVIAALTDVFEGVVNLRSELVGSVFQVANWFSLAGEGSYQQMLSKASGESSPLEHFWSLAVEEQFYWLWPPVMVGVLAVARGRRQRLVWVGSITATFALSAPVIAVVWGPDAAYWSTPARIAEILIGALLAVVLAGRRVDPHSFVAPVAMLVLLGCIVLFPPSSGPAYQGALPLVAVVSATLILGLQSESRFRGLLSTRPLVWLGRISYGVYLFHWPIFVILDADRTGLDGFWLTVVRFALTIVVAQVSYVLVERPIRLASGARFTFAFASSSVVLVAVVALVAVPSSLGEYWLPDQAVAAAVGIEADDTPLALLPVDGSGSVSDPVAPTAVEVSDSSSADVTSPVETLPPLPAPSRPIRVLVAGDSTAAAMGTGLIAWAAAHPDLAQVEIFWRPGCGILRGGERFFTEREPYPLGCEQAFHEALPSLVTTLDPDVVMLMGNAWDLMNRWWDGGPMRTLLDPDFRARLVVDYLHVIDSMLANGNVSIALVNPPKMISPAAGVVAASFTEPARFDVMYSVLEEIAAQRPDDVKIIAFDQWFTAAGYDQDRSVRPDGAHVDPIAAADIAERWLGEQLIRIALK